MYENDLSGIIIGCGMRVHTALGVGSLESAFTFDRKQYEAELCKTN